ncbi:MAG: ABC transporter substrate-binding protein [Synergistaceae bacterium]|nr:ABC transporter substrate-binding protein [Synergistaceae bacterium]
MGKAVLKYICLTLMILAAVLACCQPWKMVEEPEPPVPLEPRYSWNKFHGCTLTVWGRDAGLKRPYIVRAFKRYEDLTGNRIKVVALPVGEFEKVTALAFESGREAPDLILSFGGTNIDAFMPDKNFYDFTKAEWVDDITDTAISQAIYHGRVIGLPHWEASISGTIYNKKIFADLNITPPKTMKEFLRVCDILLESGVTTFYLAGGSPSILHYQFPLDTVVKDESLLRRLNDGTLGYPDLPQMRMIVEWYRLMAERGYLGGNYERNDWDGMSEALKSGRYAMMLGWDTWLYTEFKGDPSNFGLMPAFIGVPEEGTFEGPNLSMLMVNKNSPQAEAAVELVSFMADPYNYNHAFKGIYTAPVFKNQLEQISTPQYVEAAEWIEKCYHDSAAWLRIRGFSQSDAVCILRYMSGRNGYTAERCLREMETLRRKRFK